MLDFVGDQLHGVRRSRENDLCRDEHAVPAPENGSGGEGWATLRRLEAQHDLQAWRGGEPPALAVEFGDDRHMR